MTVKEMIDMLSELDPSMTIGYRADGVKRISGVKVEDINYVPRMFDKSIPENKVYVFTHKRDEEE